MSRTPAERQEALTLADHHDPVEMRGMIRCLGDIRAEMFELVRGTSLEQCEVRPGPNRWSALEHLRHLVFAEDLYINRWILRNDTPFSLLGCLPEFLRGRPGFEAVGTEPATDIEKILGEWSRIHALTLSFVAGATSSDLEPDTSDIDFGQGTVGNVLQGMAAHDLHHINKIEQGIRTVA